MNRLNDFTPFQWIREVRDRFRAKKSGISLVTDLIPAGFECYCKIFHPIYFDPAIQDGDISWDKSFNRVPPENSGGDNLSNKLKGVLHGARLVGVSANQGERHPRIRWEVLAKNYGVPFIPSITDDTFSRIFPEKSWPRFLFSPEEGTLDSTSLQSLFKTLQLFSKNGFCYIYFDLLATEDLNEQLFEGNLGHFQELDTLRVRTTPTYCWPKERNWCLCTDYDLPFTLVGGPKNLIRAICENRLLEAMEFKETAKIADYPN